MVYLCIFIIMVPPYKLQEQFSLAYIQAVASIAGYATEGIKLDFDSVDLEIRGIFGSKTIPEPIQIEVQVKSISNVINLDLSKPHFSYSLPVKNYHELRIVNRRNARLLVVLLMPNELSKRLIHTTEKMELRQCAYWLDLFGLPDDLEPEQEHKTVHIPLVNLFSPEQLQKLMVRALNFPDEKLSLID